MLELAGLAIPRVTSGRSLLPVLAASASGRIDPTRDHVLTVTARHVPAQERPSWGGTPMRAIRTAEFLYIRPSTR
ncbi:MAG: hypothetical protein AAF628_33505 [Planctomycetota bacterium]